MAEEKDMHGNVLSRSSLEAYASIFIAIITVVFKLTWEIKLALLIFLALMLADLSYKSPWTIGWKKFRHILCILSLLILAGISWGPLHEQYREERPNKIADIAPTTPPNMTAQVRSATLGELTNPRPVAQVTFHIDVRNSGPPTTTNSWQMSVKLRDGKSYQGTLVKYATDHYIEGRPDKPIKIVKVEDYIWKKTEQEPIALGGSIDGYITFLFPGLLRDQVGDLDSILTLSWKDTRDNSYNFDYKMPAQHSVIDFTTRPNSDASTPRPKPQSHAGPASPIQDNSVHIGEGAKVDQGSTGPCSPNIIGGSPTVNCGPPALEIKWSVRDVDPPMTSEDKHEFKYEKQVTVRVNREYTPVSLELVCDAEIEEVNEGMEGAYMRLFPRTGIDVDNKKVGFAYFEGTPVTPGRPLYISVWSNHPLSILEVRQANIKVH